MANKKEEKKKEVKKKKKHVPPKPVLKMPVINTRRSLLKDWFLNYQDKRYILGIMVLVFILIYTMLPEMQLFKRELYIGNISSKDIKAKQDFLIEDKTSTHKKQLEAREKVLSIYDFDLDNINRIINKISTAFTEVRLFYKTQDEVLLKQIEALGKVNHKKLDQKESKEKKEKLLLLKEERKKLNIENENNFKNNLNIEILPVSLTLLNKNLYPVEIEDGVKKLIKRVMEKGVVGSRELLNNERGKGINICIVGLDREQIIENVDSILDINMAKEEIEKFSISFFRKGEDDIRKVALEMAQKLIQPNLTFNRNETEVRKKKAEEEVKPVFYQIKRGEMIIREGERVTENHLAKLSALEMLNKESNFGFIAVGLTLLIIFIICIFWYYLQNFEKTIIHKFQDLLLLTLIMVINIIIIKVFILISRALANSFSNVDFLSYLYSIPAAAGAMVVATLFEVQIALIFSLLMGLFVGLVVNEGIVFVIIAIAGSFVGAFSVFRCNQRTGLLKAGLWVGLANIIVILSFNMIEGTVVWQKTLFSLLFGMGGGFTSAVIVSGALPILEAVFKKTTDIKLLELGNLSQPLLKELMMSAPGTYHHSILVGNLAEAAAEMVDANPLLTRVSSYYHDVGKIKKPEYFIENQMNSENKHEKLAPSMSSLILTSHVKDGVELARKHKLPQAIIDIIQQHHGTNIISFFYQKAKEQQSPELPPVKEEDYRYPGPKPQTKEAAIIVLADAVEASSRVLSEPTPARIQGLIQKVINNIFIDGQLDECELSLKDLHQIANVFTRIVTGTFHRRVDYPETSSITSPGDKKQSNGYTDQKSTEADKAQPKGDKKSNTEDIKRLGIS